MPVKDEMQYNTVPHDIEIFSHLNYEALIFFLIYIANTIAS
jgi:hypothetical protein